MNNVKTPILLVFCWALATGLAQADSGLIEALTSGLGVTQEQAGGGAGAIFNYAKQQLDPGQFSQVAAAVPGMDDMMAIAPQAGGMGGSWAAPRPCWAAVRSPWGAWQASGRPSPSGAWTRVWCPGSSPSSSTM